MRIAYILNTLEVGGAERQVVAMAERFRDRGHVVKLMVLRGSSPLQLRTGLDVLHLNASRDSPSALRSYWRAVAELRRFRPDILHSHQFHGNMLGRAVRIAMPAIPLVSTIHNLYEGGRARMLAYRLTDPLVTRTVAVCNAAADRFSDAKAISRYKTTVIANGIDCRVFTPNAERRRETRASMKATGFVWIAIGRTVPAKDYPTMLRAFATVRAMQSEARLWIVGEGNGAYGLGLQRTSEALGIASAVQRLGLRNDIPALLDAADGFVLSSAWEGMPLALGEAMAMKKPFIATEVGGVRQLAGDCGTLVPAGNAAALSAAMIELMRSGPEARSAAGEVSRARIVNHFGMEATTEAWEHCYTEAISECARPSRR